jgi:hypothetical protein
VVVVGEWSYFMSFFRDALQRLIENRHGQRNQDLEIDLQRQEGLQEVVLKHLQRFLELHREHMLFPTYREFLML